MALPSKIPVAAFTIAWGQDAAREAKMCEASFRHWHPDIPFLRLGEKEYQLLSGGHPPVWPGEIVSLRSLAGWFLSQRVERLVYLDSDLFVLGRLDRLLKADAATPTSWTSDWAVYTMGVPECPRINSGVLASSDPLFWQTWTAAQYGCLVPALDRFYFNQLSLRLLVQAGAVHGQIIDGKAGLPFYNVSIGEQPGEWTVKNRQVFKGTERALIYHQAGDEKRGIAAAPLPLQPLLEEITRPDDPLAPAINFETWWQEDGASFSALLKEQFAQWPTITMENLLPQVYARTPGKYRTVTPIPWDRHRRMESTSYRRFWNPQWQAYLYYLETSP